MFERSLLSRIQNLVQNVQGTPGIIDAVDGIVDMVGFKEIVGRIGQTRVRTHGTGAGESPGV